MKDSMSTLEDLGDLRHNSLKAHFLSTHDMQDAELGTLYIYILAHASYQ